ncbi:hypothetical protein BU16DRAFT_532391 [Lophium mytilinum]|uniref:Uncharacterized protein n=1 Tax=Lophium mytilinum TaxID=390894 RepID=A0A6A6RES8_9PEZI|nr:hypothetical protein BU16DRAFT_532391 [Lophium mytilinum]
MPSTSRSRGNGKLKEWSSRGTLGTTRIRVEASKYRKQKAWYPSESTKGSGAETPLAGLPRGTITAFRPITPGAPPESAPYLQHLPIPSALTSTSPSQCHLLSILPTVKAQFAPSNPSPHPREAKGAVPQHTLPPKLSHAVRATVSAKRVKH